MLTKQTGPRFVTAIAGLALLAGCSGGGSGLTTPGQSVAPGQSAAQSVARSASLLARVPKNSHSVARPDVAPHKGGAVHPFVNSTAIDATSNTIAISDAADNVVNVYDSSGNLLAQLTGFSEPQGMASDIKGDLFVADTANSRIQIYAAGFKSPPTTLSDPGQYPAGVDSFHNGEWVAASNIISTSGGAGSVTIYKSGVAQATISNPTFARVYFCAFDATGNLYVDGSDPNGSVVVGEIAKATSGGTTLATLTTGNTISFPGQVQVTTTGQIAIDDQLGPTVYTYNPPKSGSLGSPVSTTSLSGSSDPVTFAFTNDMKDLYTADAGLAVSNEFAYPAGGSPVSTINVGGQPIGTAVIPTQYPKKKK